MGFQARKSRVEESLKTICADTHGFSSSKIQRKKLENHKHIIFEAQKSKGEESFKTMFVGTHGFSSLKNLCVSAHSPYESCRKWNCP
jgi:hypothetical protein